MIGTQNRFSFLLGIGFLICAADGFGVWFRPILVSENLHRVPITLQLMPVDTTKILGYRYINGRPPIRTNQYFPLHAVKKNSKTSIATIDNSNNDNNKSIGSKKIREIASFVCVQLLQIAITESFKDDGGETEMNLEAVENLTRALQMSRQSEEPSASVVVEQPSASPSASASALPLPLPLPLPSQHTQNYSTAAFIDDAYDYNESTPAPKLDLVEVEKAGKETSAARRTEPSLSAPIDRPKTSPFVSVTPEDSATGAPIEEDDGDTIVSQLNNNDEPEPRAEAPGYSVSPLEIVASDVVPLRPSSIPQKRIPIVVATKDENSMFLPRPKADELFRRRLLQKRIEYEAAAVVGRNPNHQPMESLQTTSTPQTADESSEDMHVSGLFLEQQQKSEELFRRKLLKRQLDNSAKNNVTPKIGSVLPNKNASEIHSDALESIDTQKLLENEEAKAGELFQRRLSAKKLEYDAEVAARIQIMKDPKKKRASIDIERPCTLEKEESKADELFQRRLLAKKIDYDTKAIETKRKEEASLPEKSSTATISVASKPDELLSISEKKADEYMNRRRSTKKFEYAAKAIEITQQEKYYLPKISASDTISVASKSIENLSSSENETKKADEIEYDANKICMEDEKFQKDSLEDNEFGASNTAERAIEMKTRKAEELFQRRLLGEAIKYDSRARKKSGEDENAPSSSNMFGKNDFTEENGPISPISDEESNPDPVSMPSDREDTNDNAKEDASRTVSPDDWVSSLPTFTRERYAREARLSHSFEQKEFKPTRWSLNNHFQTIVGTLFRKEAMYSRGAKDDVITFLGILSRGNVDASDEMRKPLEEFQWDKRCRVETNDGDYYVVDWKYANDQNNYDNAAATYDDGDRDDDGVKSSSSSSNDDNPVCLICHGLESCSDSEIVREIAIACNDIKIDAACLNFRGCHDSGEECNLTTRGYHLGFTNDLMQQIEQIHATNPNRRIYLSGFSLGAGVVTKLLGELGPKAYDYNICGAAANAVPFDCGQNHKALNGPGFTKSVYGDRLLKSMKMRLSKQHDQGVFTFDKSEIEKCQTIMDLENLAIAPPFGFENAYDYYDKVKTVDKLHRVCVPQFVIQARDDPFFVGLEEVVNDETIPLRVQYTKHGGHCGFIFHQRDPEERHSKTSWMPRQLARFFAHIEETTGGSDSIASDGRNNHVVLVAKQSAAASDCLV